MRIQRTGRIVDGLCVAGSPDIPVYLLDGDRPAIIEGGMAFMAPHYARDVATFLQGRPPAWCLLTHSHFDHCGAVSFLKRRFPGLRAASSLKAREIFARPGARILMKQLSEAAAKMAVEFGLPPEDGAVFEPFEVERILDDRETIRLSSDLTVQVIATPGHTRDSLSYYVPEKKILLPSEAVGIPDQTGYITIDCLVDYDLYHRSHSALAALDVDVLCLGHRVVLTGEDARRHMIDSLAQCERFRDMVAGFLREENGDLERVKQRVKAYEYDGKPDPKQPQPAYLLNLDARVKAIARLAQADA
jgi:glyoxylase-like metal-dependent hydrolase (beta-lactamase superfamily II)